MDNQGTSIVIRVYHSIVENYPSHFNYATEKGVLPMNGINLFFEKGETIIIEGREYARIVQVGSHLEDGRFPDRMRQHYGNVSSLRGNKNTSVLRKHIGGAIMRKENPNDPRLTDWLTQMGPSYVDIEEKVSRTLRDNFTFICFPVKTKNERLSLETSLISLLSQYPLGEPSPTWLGLWADNPVIRSTGLWNINRRDNRPLSETQLATIRSYMKEFRKG